jgi:hypothetical protein
LFSRVEDAIRDMSVADYLAQFKEYAPVSERIVNSKYDIARYAKTHMDETEIA